MTRNKVVLFDASFSASKLYFALKSKRVGMVPKDLIATISRYANAISRQHMTPHVAFVFDLGKSAYRLSIFDGYKGQRAPNPERTWFVKLFRSVVDAMGVTNYGVEGVEADDIIATLCQQSIAAFDDENVVTIIAGCDKDFKQLLTHHIRQFIPDKNWVYTRQTFVSQFGFEPKNFTLYQALIGDNADNISGAIGSTELVRAKAIVSKCTSIDEIIETANKCDDHVFRGLSDSRELLERNLKLVTLLQDVPVTATGDGYRRRNVDDDKMQELYFLPAYEEL